MAVNDGPAIPERYIQFAREVARLAMKYQLRSFDLNIHPGYEDYAEWRDMICIGWKQGRHGEDSNDLRLSSAVQRFSQVEVKSEEPAGGGKE